MRLRYRVPILVLVVMLVIGLATGVVMVRLQRDAGEDEFKQTAIGLAGAVRGSLEEYMLEPDVEHGEAIEPAVTGLVKEKMVDGISIYEVDGSILASGGSSNAEERAIDEAVQHVLESGETVTQLWNGRTELSVVTPIQNKAECRQTCHGDDGDVLGAVQVTLDTETLADRERQQIIIMLLVGGVTFFLVGGAVTYVVNRTVLRPLNNLGRSAERISGGDYTARAVVKSRDELGQLAMTFNEMTDRVGARTQEIEQLNAELENRVLQRTGELSALNAVISVASESLDLDKILNDTLDKVMQLLDMDAGVMHVQRDAGFPALVIHRGLCANDWERVGKAGLDECLVGQSILLGKSVSGIAGPDSDSIPALEGREFQSHVSVPIESKGRVLGALCLFSRSIRQFDSKAFQPLETMGHAIGASVENAQVAEKLERANTEINILLSQAMKGGFDVRYDNPHLVKCWEEKICDDKQCTCYHEDGLRCWQIVGTFSESENKCRFSHELGSCTECEVYRNGCWHDAITAIGENFNNMMFLLRREAERREEDRQQFIERVIAAQEDERKRIARELHDETGQALTMVMTEVAKVMNHLPEEMEDARKGMASAREAIREALANLRNLIFDLRPEVLDDLGLVPALRTYVRSRSAVGGIQATFEHSGTKRRLPSQIEVLLFRVVQEAITNVLRHAQASQVHVQLKVVNNTATAIIRDNGEGFDAECTLRKTEAWGLRGMRERVALLRGQFFIESEPGKGTQVRVSVPLEGVDG